MKKTPKTIEGVVLILALVACTFMSMRDAKRQKSLSFSYAEKMLIDKSDSVMYVLDVANPEDSVMLRELCLEIAPKDMRDWPYRLLKEKMLATVQSPRQGGVGIAGPQVGIPRRIIVVCRMDKPGEPYEVYPNVRIDSLYGEIGHGPEGCLSIPPYRGVVPRYESVIITYTDENTLLPVSDTVSGYTAIIFQHECDHLDGILYPDRADTVFVDEAWKAERDSLAALGLYNRPAEIDLDGILSSVRKKKGQ